MTVEEQSFAAYVEWGVNRSPVRPEEFLIWYEEQDNPSRGAWKEFCAEMVEEDMWQ